VAALVSNNSERSSSNNSRFCGGSSLRLARKSSNARGSPEGFFPQTEDSSQEAGLRDRITSPVFSSLRMILLALESEFGGQAHGLASAILKKLAVRT